jgi:N-acylglucosamine 2-epimerase
MDALPALEFYRDHVEQVLLPFWIRASDYHHGGVYTCYNNSGDRLTSTDKYTWSQGRYLWLWSKIAAMIPENSLRGDAGMYYEQASKTARFLEENVFLDNGNCAFLLTETGEKKESMPQTVPGFDSSIYADCFVVLGLSEFAGLSKDLQRFERSLELYYRIVERLNSGDFRSEPYPVPEGYRSHSFPMIMLNVTQGLADAAITLQHSASGELHQRCIAYMKEIMEFFFLPDHRVAELMPDDPADKATLLYRHINPGHTIESMWFVMQAARKTANSGYIQKAVDAIEKAVGLGWDSEYGGLFRFVDAKGGRPAGKKKHDPYEKMITDTWDMKLWWPHSEALYATLLGNYLTGNKKMLKLHNEIKHYTFETFPNPDKEVGEWIQTRNRKGEPLDQVAALPVKDPFHILRNLLLIIELLEV